MELPHDKNLEQDVLGTLLRYNEHIGTYEDIIAPDMFYEEDYGVLYRTAVGIVSTGGITDINSLRQYMSAHNMQSVPTETIVEVMMHCAERTLEQNVMGLRVMWRKRKVWEILVSASQQVVLPSSDLTDTIDSLSQSIASIGEASVQDDGISSFADAMDEVSSIVADNQAGIHSFFRTDFKLFDSHYLIRPRSMTIIAAFTSVGKSVLSLNISMNVAKYGVPVAIYSLEMGKSELAARASSRGAQIPSGRILNSKLSMAESQALHASMDELRNLPIYIEESGSSDWSRMLRSVRRMVAKKGVRLVVIDYLQIFAQTGDSSEAFLSRCAREAKNISRELNIAVILVSQLNRSDKHPSIRMLRGSGQIEESADNVILIDRPEAYPDGEQRYVGEFSEASVVGTAKLILSKGRNVGTGCTLIQFDGKHTRFFDGDGHGNELPFAPAADDDSQLDWNNITN